MVDENESILKDMEQTRTSMTEKLEAIEHQIADKVQPVTEAVERVSEAATAIVENVKETIHDVSARVENTVDSVASAFNLSKQTAKHPWVAVSIAALTGCMVGSFVGRRWRYRQTSSRESHGTHSKQRNGTSGASHQAETARTRRVQENAEPQQVGWFDEQLNHLKGFAISALMSTVRDLAKQAIPSAIGVQLAKEIDSLTTRMGGSPIEGPIFDMKHKKAEEESKAFPELEKANASGDQSGAVPEPVNRISGGNFGMGSL